MAATVSAGERAARGADSGLMLKADGTVYDLQAALANLVAILGGGGEAGTDLDDIRIATEAALVFLAAIDASNTNIDASNTNIETAVQLIDNMIGAIGVAHGDGVGVMGMKAESTVPTEVADGEAVAIWGDTFGRLVQLFTDVAQNAASVSDISPAKMQIARWLDWAALTAPGQETPEANVQDYDIIKVQYIIAAIGVSVDLIIWGSIDGGATWYPKLRWTVLAADEQTDAVLFSCDKDERIKGELDAEDGGTPTVTFKVLAGN